MRLVCPRCGAQYEIDGAAIPPAGRDVECSACDHVWRASRRGAMPDPAAPAPPSAFEHSAGLHDHRPPPGAIGADVAADPPGVDPAPFDPAARPALSRPLSDDVIAILREEASFELESRAAGRRAERAALGASGAPAQPPASGDRGAAADLTGGPAAGGPSWTAAPTGAADWLAGPDPDAVPAQRHDADGAEADPVAAGTAPADPRSPDAAPANVAGGHDAAGRPAQSDTPPAGPADVGLVPPPPRRRYPLPEDLRRAAAIRARRSHDAGFHVAVMAAVIGLSLYAVAPGVAGQGPIGTALMSWRDQVDRGRDWLDDKANELIGIIRPR